MLRRRAVRLRGERVELEQPQLGAEFSVPLRWIDFDETPIVFTNHFLAQHQPNEFVLTLGGLTRDRLVQLIETLQATPQDHDRTFGTSS